MGATLLAACAGAPQAEAPTSAPAPTAASAQTSAPAPTAPAAPTSQPEPTVAGTQTEADIKAGIQQALDLYALAYNENKPELLKQAADQTNAPFRRFIIGITITALESDQLLPIVDNVSPVEKRDIAHIYSLPSQDRFLAYGEGYTLVEYIDQKYGGLDAFWKLVQVYDKEQNFEKALQGAFGVSYEQFDKDWRAWLKEKYT